MGIRDIAEAAGVSASTVSRVLNDPDYKCSDPKRRDLIWRLAMEQGYTPNEAARNLKLGKRDSHIHYFSVLMSRADAEQTDPFFAELLRVVESEIHNHNCILSRIVYKPILSDDKKCAGENLKKLTAGIFAEETDHSDGLIILGKCNASALRYFTSMYRGVVSINRNSTNYEVDEVTCDGKKIAAMATQYLISLGHERIAYIGSCKNEARYDGFIETLSRHDLVIHPEYLTEVQHTERDGFKAMEKICRLPELPTAVYCANDIIAIGALKYLSTHRLLHYRPSIIGSDDISEAQNTDPMLTTIRVPRMEMGRFALYLLMDRLSGGHSAVTRVELEGRLMARTSCAPPSLQTQ